MLNRDICAACRKERFDRRQLDIVKNNQAQWRCPAKMRTHNDCRVSLHSNKPPKGCFKLFEHSVDAAVIVNIDKKK